MLEIDEICVRKSPAQWLWIAVSRSVRQVLGFALGDRSEETLDWMWQDVPEGYRPLPVKTDGLKTYQSFFGGTDHEACDKGSGKTSIVEALNTKWRQRQSGLVRRSCGVWIGIEQDIVERFMILLEAHNRQCMNQWISEQTSQQLT